MITIRPVGVDDAEAIAELRGANRDYLAPWEPAGREASFTAAGQRESIAAALERWEADAGRSYAIVGDAARIIGVLNLNSVIRGAFQSCSIGYWVARSESGRGVATAAVGLGKAVAFGELGLHRVQAETLTDNHGSMKVLERNGFQRYGLAPAYLKIAGRWQDHVLFQAINPDAD